MTFQRQCVLRVARDTVAVGDVFAGDAHVDRRKGICERAGEHVDHARRAHARAPAHAFGLVGRAAHHFGSAGQRDVGLAQHDRLCGRQHRLQPGAAEAIDGKCGGFHGDAGLDRDDAREVHVARFGLYHLAEDDVSDLRGRDPGATQRFGGDQCAELRGRAVRQGAAEFTDGGTDSGDEINLVHLGLPFLGALELRRCHL